MRIIKNRKNAAFKFQPFSQKQSKLLYWWEDNSPYKNYDMVVADGAIRSGKTVAMICSFLRFTQKRHKAQNFIIAGKTAGSLKRNVIQPMLQILTAWGWDYYYNRSDNYIVVGSNTYYLFGANTEASQDSLQGLTAAGGFADEVALFPQSFVEQMIGRCSVSGSKLFFNCNPKSPYHYFKENYIDKAEEKRIYHLHFTMDDNLSLAAEVKERFKRMFSGVFFKRYILGLWVQAEGIIYDMFSDEHIVRSEERAYIEYYVAADYGTQNPMVFLLFGKTLSGQWYLVDEYYYSGRDKGAQKTDEEYHADLVAFLNGRQIRQIIIDPSAASFIATVRKHALYNVRKGKNDVIQGIRNTATALMKKEILINDCCKNTIKEFYSYVWDEKALERGEDLPTKVNDHCLDALRYFINTVLSKSTTIFK